MDTLFESFVENIKILPKSIKYICKMISILITKKFPNILKVEQNAFISQFLFLKIILPILNNPIDIYFNNFIISQNTIHNLRYITNIFIQFVLGNFYNNTDAFNYTPFNWFFIDNMPKMFESYENIIDIKLPDFIEKLINEQLPEDYNYEYFNENPEQMIFHKSFCFSLNEFSCLMKNMNKCKNILFSEFNNNNNIINNNIINNNNNNNNEINKNDKNKDNLFKLYKIFEQLNTGYYKNYIKSLQESNNFEVINDNLSIIPNIILINELLINPKYEVLFNIQQIKPYFYLNEIDLMQNNEDTIKNEIIKTKNYISGLLYNCRDLEKSDFSSKKKYFRNTK